MIDLWKRKWIEENQAKHLLNSTKQNAKAQGREWNLTLEDIVIPERCPYLDVPLTNIQGQGIVWTNASVDRIDSSLGYVKGNIEVVSRLANLMKQGATQEQLIKFAKGVLAKYDKS